MEPVMHVLGRFEKIGLTFWMVGRGVRLAFGACSSNKPTQFG